MQPLPVKTMPSTLSGDDPALLTQCLEFCQVLASKGQAFNLSLTLGSSFTFSLDTRGGTTPVMQKKKKKKSSPSTLRRNQKRKEEFLQRKSESDSGSFKCDQCGKSSKSENGLKIHKGKAHKKAEVLRSQDPEVHPLEFSPPGEKPREEQCTSPPSHPSSPSSPCHPSLPPPPAKPPSPAPWVPGTWAPWDPSTTPHWARLGPLRTPEPKVPPSGQSAVNPFIIVKPM